MNTVTGLSNALGVTPATIRRWSGEFSDYLSRHASPPPGETRVFSDDDAAVLALVAEMRRVNIDLETITAALAAGERGQWPPDNRQDDAGETQQAPMALVTQLTAKASSLEGELKATKTELDRRIAELKDAQDAARESEKRATIAETKLEALSIMGDDETPAAVDVQSQGESWRVRLSRWISGAG
jgi:DNA-binding transcriptional MerR regulator